VPQRPLQTWNPFLVGFLASWISKRYSKTYQQQCQRTSPAQIVLKRDITLSQRPFRLLLLARSLPFNPCAGRHLSVGSVLSKNHHCYIVLIPIYRWPRAHRNYSRCQHCDCYGSHNVEGFRVEGSCSQSFLPESRHGTDYFGFRSCLNNVHHSSLTTLSPGSSFSPSFVIEI